MVVDKKGGLIMMKTTMFGFMIFIVISLMFLSLAWSVDELVLTGIVKSYSKEKGTIIVDVKSEGCRGLREFILPEGARHDLDPSLIGQRIEFKIDSNRCERGRVYHMILR